MRTVGRPGTTGPRDEQPDRVDVLDRASCLDLLRSVVVGRLAWAAADGWVHIRPVNFGLDGESVVIRCGPGSMLAAIRAGARVGFEADGLEPALRSGWSVLVVGAATEVLSGPTAGLRSGLVDPWAGGARPQLVALRGGEISGRRLRLGAGAVSVVRLGADDPAG